MLALMVADACAPRLDVVERLRALALIRPLLRFFNVYLCGEENLYIGFDLLSIDTLV